MRLYLDACCWNRPFDVLEIRRNRLEADAVLEVLRRIRLREHEVVISDTVRVELNMTPSPIRKARVARLIVIPHVSFVAADPEYTRAAVLMDRGLEASDALHVACAESAKCEVLLTTDDALQAKCRRHSDIMVRVVNPLQWIAEVAMQ